MIPVKPRHVTERAAQLQRSAADPGASAWVSANAGSGKTTVLVARVVRLLLAGVRPDDMLCLTFTKAAAANMANRVFDTLGRWVTLTDDDLDAEIGALTGQRPSREERTRARRLFAHAIETPGGLKVQTIHAFCERVLQLFPFEANVAARFNVLDDAQSRALVDEAIRDIVEGEDPNLAGALERMAEEATEATFRDVLSEAMRDRAFFRREIHGPAARRAAGSALARVLGVADGETGAEFLSAYAADGLWAGGRWRLAEEALEASGVNDRKMAAGLRAAGGALEPETRWAGAERLFLTKDGQPKAPATLMTKKLRERQPDLADAIDAEQERFLAARERLRAVRTVERTRALYAVVNGVVSRYEAAKAKGGSLDFDDLIEKTAALFARSDASWVLYKLDMAVGHLLVDEAQDTSRLQWDILRRLTAEFTSGSGARSAGRTIFAVGDEKQSIYSFQGAAPRAFGETRAAFEAEHRAAERPFERVDLTVSFRSTPEILSAVDRVFEPPTHHKGLVFDEGRGPPPHESGRLEEPGFVELWPVEGPAEGEGVDDAFAPGSGNAPEADAPTSRLARRVATNVRLLTEQGDPSGRGVRPGDVMILVRQRGPLFEALIAALKTEGLPVAGADRLTLGGHIAVQDLIALGRASLRPEDDYALACLLKSPLVGFTDDDLLLFAPGARGSLADALEEAGRTHVRLEPAARRVREWQALAHRSGAYAFYAAILEAQGGRRALVSRLGHEAMDAVDEFLSRAYRFEQDRLPSLTAFLQDFEGGAIEIKRDLDQTGNEVRVMTVHAAKGLEAPIVILPDTTSAPAGRHDSALLCVQASDGSGRLLPVWAPKASEDTPATAGARAAWREEQSQEHRRLLYVAMTRAENGLIVAGASGRAVDSGSWYAMVERALSAEGEGRIRGRLAEIEGRDGSPGVRRWALEGAGVRPAPAPVPRGATPLPAEAPVWLFTPAPPEPPEPPPLRPSSAVEAADRQRRPGDGVEGLSARARGRFAHKVMEALPACPKERRGKLARAIADRQGGFLSRSVRETILADVAALMERADLAPLFSDQRGAEIPVAGPVRLPSGETIDVAGQIDRLAVTETEVLLADFKTGVLPPSCVEETPPQILAQLALYRALVRPLFPGKRVASLVVWTAGPVVHHVPDALLDAALGTVSLAAAAPA